MKNFRYFVFFIFLLPTVANSQFLFHDATDEAKIYQQSGGTQNIGPGVVILDFNNDGWDDIYMAGGNDSDKLYRNNKDGTFTESLENQMHSISNASMGADMADINNDGLPDIFVTEMLPEKESRLKWKMNNIQ